MDSILPLLLLVAQLGTASGSTLPIHAEEDLRADYDVGAYRLDLSVDPSEKRLSGTVAVEARVTSDELSTFELDLQKGWDVSRVIELEAPLTPAGEWRGAEIKFEHEGARLDCHLGKPMKRGEPVRVAVTYSGKPGAKDSFEGFHWKTTAEGKPWITTSCQGEGSSSWWPCKDSFFHPEDKPERTFVNLNVPAGLYAVSNGRLVSRDRSGDRETFHWVHEYPCETYSITLDVAPYVVVEQALKFEGLADPLSFTYYVLPEDAEKAKLQFEDAPKMLAVYSHYFGPFPFPKSKYALVETSFWGMEHSSAVAYGSSFPAWCKANGKPDRYAGPNKFFDYILIHESAHEWWGNAVSAKSWGHFWIHEGFATYAEGVYVESTQGKEAAERYFAGIRNQIGKSSRLYRGDHVDSEQAYANVLYTKGAWVLHTLRGFVDDDEAWWRTLKAFNLEFRYKNADTEDFRAVLERETKKDWKRFFDEWFYGTGYPEVKGEITEEPDRIAIDVDVGSSSDTQFHLPLVITWRENGEAKRRRIELAPGHNSLEIKCASPREVACPSIDQVLGRHSLRVKARS
jgi:aminopeptidase N